MRYLLTGSEMKKWEKRTMETYHVPSILLMERAAGAVVKELLSGAYDLHKILLVCGTGNNGGDGLAAARMLKMKNMKVDVCLVGNEDAMTEETRMQFQMYQAISGKMVTTPEFEEYTVIVDALLGIGCNREVVGIRAEFIKEMNQAEAKVVSVDVPSGISADTGKICGIAVKADVTITFFTEKLGMILYPGREHCGKIIVDSLDMPFDVTEDCVRIIFEENDLNLLPVRRNDSHKGTFGKVLVVAGSSKIFGAAYLAAAGAYRMGAGLVKVYTPLENQTAMQKVLPEAMLEIYDCGNRNEKQLEEAMNWADVIVVGPGLGTDAVAEEILKQIVFHSTVPMIIDADGINLLAKNVKWIYSKKAEMILTPHILEMARLSGIDKSEVQEHRLQLSKEFTEKYPVTLVLKDAATIVAKHQELLYINTSGNSGMATGGSGDVLAGIIGGLLAQGMKVLDAARLGVYFHGKAGDAAAVRKGVYGMIAGDILDGMIEVAKR